MSKVSIYKKGQRSTNVTATMKDLKRKCNWCSTSQHIMYLVQFVKKVFPTSSSLSDHFTAVHDKLKLKHKIEREASLRIHKVKRFNSRV